MTTTPTPEEFLALTDPEDDVDDAPAYVDVVLTRGPGPDSDFVELEDPDGRGLGPNSGAAWVDRGDGFAVLRIPVHQPVMPVDPLVSIAESLRRIAAGCTGATFFEAELQSTDDSEAQERYDRLDQEYADLEDKHRSLFELLAEVEKIIKPSTSKLANSVREAITRWKALEVPADIDPEEPADPDVAVVKPLQTPAHDADVEEWRAYAHSMGLGDRSLMGLEPVDTMNRSQIRTLLGIEQPVEDRS